MKAEDCKGCDPETHENPFEPWEVISENGIDTLSFAANTAMDTDGDVNTYKRTELERTPVPGSLSKDTLLVAEHQVRTSAEDGATESKLEVFLIDAEVYAQRTENPELDYFFPKAEHWAMLHSQDDFIESFGVDEDRVSLEQAKKILATPEYARLRAILLSTKAL